MRYTKQPRIDRKTKKQTGYRYEFWRYQPEKRRYERVPVSALPSGGKSFESDEQALAYCGLKSAEENAICARIEQRLQWETKFQNMPALIESFAKQQKLDAPNSWQADIHNLKAYAFAFFLGEKKCNNVLSWYLFFDEFKVWLQSVRPLKSGHKTLAYNTMNRIIKATNKFIAFNSRKSNAGFIKCKMFERKYLRKIGANDIPDKAESELIKAQLKEIRPLSYLLYTAILNTGLRINEALGVCPAFIFEGNLDGPKSKKIHTALTKYDLGEYKGYICLESQPALDCLRLPDGTVPRKPLKLRPSIDPKYYRYIAISDVETWNIIVDLHGEKMDQIDKCRFGNDLRNYILFDGLTASMFYCDIAKVYLRIGHPIKSPHKLRHAFLTPFYDKTNEDQFLAEVVGGHRDKRIIENYSHIAEQIGNEQKQKIQSKARLKRAI